MITPKKAVKQVIKHLPDDVSWDDIVYRLHVRRQIEEGLVDSKAGRTIPVE
jgi:hypothetical protein